MNLDGACGQGTRHNMESHPTNKSVGSPERDHANLHIFEELLDAEVAVNVHELREASRLGIPSRYRAVVYRYLLGVALVDRSREMTMERSQDNDFDMLQSTYATLWQPDSSNTGGGGKKDSCQPSRRPSILTVQPMNDSTVTLMTSGESKAANFVRCSARGTTDSYAAWRKAVTRLRHTVPYSTEEGRWTRMSATLAALQAMYDGASAEDVDHIVALTIPFDAVHANARDVFYCVMMMYTILTHNGNILESPQALQRHCGTFLMLFRAVNAVLYHHFYVEGLTMLEWVPGMLTTLLAGKLLHDDLLRLWDYCLADISDALTFSIHPFVCLAILADLTEDLLECERTDILHRLNHLPHIDAAATLQRAIAIREEVFTKRLLPSR